MKYEESKKRSLLKTITWRVLATCLTLLIAYLFTENFTTSLELTLVAALASTVAYYIHERIWNLVMWERNDY